MWIVFLCMKKPSLLSLEYDALLFLQPQDLDRQDDPDYEFSSFKTHD